MRVAVVCVALCCWAGHAAAQVSFVRRAPADAEIAAALEQLIGDRVVLVAAPRGSGIDATDPTLARVSIDRKRALLHVVSRSNPEGLTRALSDELVASSPYAVALAAAELLDLLHVTRASLTRAEPPATGAAIRASEPRRVVVSAAVSPVAPARETELAVRDRSSETDEDETDTATVENKTQPSEARIDADEAQSPLMASARSVNTATPELRASASAAASGEAFDSAGIPPRELSGADPRLVHGPRLSSYAFGVDLELQTQPGHDLSFVRPAAYGELAWGRATGRPFWTLGARVSAPLAHDLQPLAAGVAADTRVRADAMDAALQAGAGYAFGRLGLLAQVGAGMSYLRIDAFDADRHALGHDAHFSPLLAAGLGVRLSVALGFALAVRGEAQWSGPGAVYKVFGDRVLDGGPFRLGFLAGILWESALARLGP